MANFSGVTAVELVVQHVFLKSSPLIADTNEIKELETQRDVLLTMLLKLSHNPRVSLFDELHTLSTDDFRALISVL